MTSFSVNIFFITLITCNLIRFLSSNTKINVTYKRYLTESSNLDFSNTVVYKNEAVSDYLSNYVDEEGNLFLITTATKSSKNRLIYALNSKGRNYFSNSLVEIYEFSNDLSTTVRNTFTIIYDKIKYLVIFDDSRNFQFIDLTNFIKYSLSYDRTKLHSEFNTIISNGDNTFYMCHFYTEQKAMITTLWLHIENSNFELADGAFKSTAMLQKNDGGIAIDSNSLSCLKSQNFIQCIYESTVNDICIGIYDINTLNDLSKITLLETDKPQTSCVNCFRKGINIKDDIGAFMYFINGKKKVILSLKNIYFDSSDVKSDNVISEFDSKTIDIGGLNNEYDKNDLLRISDYKFCLISTFESDSENLLFLLFGLYNSDKTLYMRRYEISLNGNTVNKNLKLFLYKNFIGYSNTIKISDTVYLSFKILNYANSTDFSQEDFLLNLDEINPLNLTDYICIENNIFNYKFASILITRVPSKELTGLLITDQFLNENIFNDTEIDLNTSILFNYIGNISVTEGEYYLEFIPIIYSNDLDIFDSNSGSVEIIGEETTNFESSKYTGRYGIFSFKIKKHNDFGCHKNCYICHKNVISDNEQYCTKCNSNSYFIENTENCFEKTPLMHYFNKDINMYSRCYDTCLTCSDKETNSTNMNCITCVDGYKFYSKNNNCLNCSKYVDYEQTSCIDIIPNKFYLLNSSYGIIEKCHPKCSICSKGYTEKSMNCDYCINGYYLLIDDEVTKNCYSNDTTVPSNYYSKEGESNIYYKCYELCGSCFKDGNSTQMNCKTCINDTLYEYDEIRYNCDQKINCEYSYYYYVSENNIRSKVCLGKGVFCPEILPYENVETKECIETCSFEQLITKYCIPSNIQIVYDDIIKLFRNEVVINNYIINNVINNSFTNITIKGYNSTYEITTTQNEEQKIISGSNDDVSIIDLGKCEEILKTNHKIPSNISLIIVKIDIIKNNSHSRQVEYEIYDPLTKNLLNLSECEGYSIYIYSPVDIDQENLDLYDEVKEQGYDLFDINDDFYNDKCSIFTSSNGTDVIISDRINDYYNESLSSTNLCENNCEYLGVNSETKKVLCECDPKQTVTENVTNEVFSVSELKNIVFSLDKITNYKVLYCYKLLKNGKQYIKNYGCIIISIVIISFLIFMILVFIKGMNIFKKYCYEIIEQRESFMKKYNIYHDNKGNYISNKKTKCVKNKKNKNSKYSNEPPKKNMISGEPKNLHNKIKNSNDKISSYEFGFSKNSLIRSNNNKDKSKQINLFLSDKNKKKLNTTKKVHNKNLSCTRIRVNSNFPPNNNRRNKTGINMNTPFLSLCTKYEPYEKRSLYFCDEELNNLDYQYAVKIDKRSYWGYYFSLIKKKNLILFSFLVNNKDYNVYFLKVSLFLCSLSLNLTINTLFYDDGTMHDIYKQEGKYDFLYQLPQILYSTIILTTITTIFKNLSLTQKDILNIKTINDIEILKKSAFKTIKQVRIKIILFFILGLLVLGSSWYYLTVFCAVYGNTQLHIIKDTIISYSLSLLYPFGLGIVPGILRIKALKTEQKDQGMLYLISKIMAFV